MKKVKFKSKKFTKGELRFVLMIVVLSIGIGIIFYRSIIPSVFLSFAAIPLMKIYRKYVKEKHREKLELQFKDGMSAFASAMRAGYSAENAMGEAQKEIVRIYGDKSEIANEFEIIKRKMSLGASIEESFAALAKKTEIKEIMDMSQVFAIAKRSGGSLTDILRETVSMLDEKQKLKEEIKTIMTAKRLEHRIMCLMPAGILIYVNLTSPEFVSSLYEGLTGRIIMTVALAVYAFAIFLGEKLMEVSM